MARSRHAAPLDDRQGHAFMIALSRESLGAILAAYAELFFLRGRLAGGVILATTFLNPNVAISGLIAVLAVFAFARLIALDRSVVVSGYHLYNPLLTGVGIGYLFQVTPLSALFIGAAAVLTFVVTMSLRHLFSTYLLLPVFSLPFTVVTWAVYLATGRFSALYGAGLYHHPYSGLDPLLPVMVSGFFKSLGTILFLPDVVPGIIFALVLLASSRILFLLALAGYGLGTGFVGLMMGSMDIACRDVSHFNFALIAMALGGVFLVPSRWSYGVAMVAVVVSAIILEAFKVFWSGYGVSGFVLPINTPTYIGTMLPFLYVLGLTRFPLMARVIRAKPEETLDYFLADQRRYPGATIGIGLPFSGRWTVWQGHDGRWTHQGIHRYACDFVLRGDDGRTHVGSGLEPADYHAFNKPVLAPVRGRVLVVENALADNAIGIVDAIRAWGNFVILQDDRGHYVCLAHFAQGSIRVAEGEWVEPGTLLGRCGNSGYSPQPHIHIQVQTSAMAGAATIPFSFVSYLCNGIYRANEIPVEGEVLEPCFPDKEQEARVTFLLEDRYRYEAFRNGRKVGELAFVVRCTTEGILYFDSGRGRLYVGSYQGTFYVYSLEGNDPYLRALFMAMPRLPLVAREGLRWNDHLPVSILFSGLLKDLVLLVASFVPAIANIRVHLQRDDPREISGIVSYPLLRIRRSVSVTFETAVGLHRVRVEDLELRRVEGTIRGEEREET
ncbi:MAG: urea transporter [Alphaproteobacteria bacterium]